MGKLLVRDQCSHLGLVDLKAADSNAMGSHHHQATILVPDHKLDCFGQLENFLSGNSAAT